MRLLVLLALVLVAKSYAAEQLPCPQFIDIKSESTAPLGWTAFVDATPHVVSRVGFYLGSPSTSASLVPDEVAEDERESLDQWRFVKTQYETIWFACFYTGTDAFLAKPLDQNVSECHVKYSTTSSGARLQVINFHCE